VASGKLIVESLGKSKVEEKFSISRGSSFSEICENLYLSVAITENKSAGVKIFRLRRSRAGKSAVNDLTVQRLPQQNCVIRSEEGKVRRSEAAATPI